LHVTIGTMESPPTKTDKSIFSMKNHPN